MTETAVRDRPQGYFERLRELFDRIAEMPAEEREAEIARSTEGDPTLAEELRGLLEHADRAETTIDNASMLGAGSMLIAGWSEPPLPVIAGFRVHRRIGRGGSATVYLADQERADFTRPVALKVVDYAMDSASLARVREEQRILARLEHAGIARLYDTGLTPLGQPYLAMEHVEGETIVDHCRSRQLPISCPDRAVPLGARRRWLRPPTRHRASRSQAGEHPRLRAGRGQVARLRDRQARRR